MKNLRKDNRITFGETKTKVCLLLSFFLPVLILLVIAFRFKIYPFSSDCVITEPLQKTYLPVITELRRKIFSGESLFYSWNVGGGSNFWGWIGAYASSPFVLLYLLFPADRIAEATQIIFALKAATAALCLFILFWKKENVVSPVSVGLSVAYGLSAYVLTYSQEPWILDTVILLPLLILTLWYLILGKRKWLFTLVCALTGISCCHSGIYMLLFVVIMFPLLYIEARHDGIKLAKLPDIIKDFFIFLCLGLGLSAFVWYPSLQALWKTAPGNEVVHFASDAKVELKAWDFLERLAFVPSLVFPSDASQLPSVYCGVFTAVLVLLYACSGKIRFSEKLYGFCTLAFIYITMCFRLFQFVIHGLHFPITGQYPQAILFTFLLMYMAGRLLSRGDFLENRKHLWFAAFAAIAFMVFRATISKSYSYASYVSYMAIGLLIIYFAVTLRIHNGPKNEKTIWMSILAVTIVLEAGLAFYQPIKEKYYHKTYEISNEISDSSVSRTVTDGFGIDPAELSKPIEKVYKLDKSILYQKPDEEEKSFALQKKEISPKGTRFYIEDTIWNNYGLLYGVPSLNSESFMTSMRYSEVLAKLGINTSGDGKSISISSGTMITDVFFQQRNIDVRRFSPEEQQELAAIFANGFFVTTENINEDLFVDNSPFVVQNNLANQLSSVKPFSEMKMEVAEMSNIKQNDDGTFQVKKSGERTKLILESEDFISDPNIPIYLYCNCKQKTSIEVKLLDIDGNLRFQNSFNSASGSCLKLDTKNARDRRLHIEITISNPEKASFGFYAVSADREKLNWYQTVTRDSAWQISELRDGYAAGTVNAKSSGHVVWSIPADEGWTATIDGEKTQTFAAYKAFLGIHIPPGTHEITIRFTPDGFRTGVFATIGSVILLIFLSVSDILPKKEKKKKDEPDKEQITEEKENEV
ncbi:MAG: YfhO family protein [Clostridiales bacterium]|nr:YfhO family protein [Clostridiales bacterium]